MAADQNSDGAFQSPFWLPPELRLQVYADMLKDFKGDFEVCRGLLHNCKLIHSELMPEMFKMFHNNLTAMLTSVQRNWMDEYKKQPLRISYSGTTPNDTVINVGIPQSVLRDEAPLVEGDDDDYGLAPVCEILHPLLTFRIKQLNFSIWFDTNMLPRRAGDEPFFHPVLEDLSCLLSRGHLKKFTNSQPGRNASPTGKVLVKHVTFDWSVATRNHDQMVIYAINASCIAMETDLAMWAVSAVMRDGSVESGEYFRDNFTDYINYSVPIRAVWIRR
jgi:hypothetical protein